MFLKSLVLKEVQITWFSFFHLIMNFARKSDPMRVLDPAHQKLCSKVLSFMISYKEKPVHGHKKTCSSEKMPDITCRNIRFYWAFFWMNDNSTPQRYDSISCIAIITTFNGRTSFSFVDTVCHAFYHFCYSWRERSWLAELAASPSPACWAGPAPHVPPADQPSDVIRKLKLFWQPRSEGGVTPRPNNSQNSL